MKPGWITTCLLLSFAVGCSPAVRRQATAEAAAGPEECPEYQSAVKLLAAGPVDRYIPLGWLDTGRKALGTMVDATDWRGSPAPALLWADLAGRAVLERPDSDLAFEILSEHVRIANHALKPEHGRSSLERLKRFASLDPVRGAWSAVLSLQSRIARTRLPDGTFRTRYWSSADPGVSLELAAVDALLGPLTAPQQADRPQYDAWIKLRIAWASILLDALTGEVAVLARIQPAGWKDTQTAFEKRLHQAIWYVPSDRYPSVTSLLYLKLSRFHRLYGEVDKANDDLHVARRLVTGAKDLDGMARVDLAEADSILTPGSSVEMLGALAGGPDIGSTEPEAPPDIRAPEPETLWRDRAARVVPLLVRAEATYRTVNNTLGLSGTRIRRGYIEARLGNCDDAAEFYRQAEAASKAALDPAGQALAWFHLVALHLSANEIGRAQDDSRELFALLADNGLTALAAGMGEALSSMAGREMTRFGTPNQRLAVIHLSARCFEVAGQPLLALAHHVALLKLSAHFGYLELVRFHAGQALAIAPPPGPLDPRNAAAMRDLRCIVSHVLASALLRTPSTAIEAVEPAQRALQCVLGAAAPPAGLDPDEVRLTAALALAGAGQPEEAYPLLQDEDPNLRLQIATRGSQTARLVELARASVALARAALQEELAAIPLPPPLPDDAEAEAPPEPDVPDSVKAAKAHLAEELVRLAGALLDDAASRGPLPRGKSSPEADEAQALLGEWKSLGVDRSALDKRPWEALALHGRLASGMGRPDAAWMFFSGALQLLLEERDRQPGASRKAAFTRSVAPTLRHLQSFLLAFPELKVDFPGLGSVSGAFAALSIHEDLKLQALSGLLVAGMEYQARLLDAQDGMAFAALGQRMRSSRCEEEYWAQADDAPPGRAENARAEHENVEVWLDQAVRDMGRKYPRLAFARGELLPPTPDALARLASQRKVTFLVYATALAEPHAWVVNAEGVRVIRLATTSTELRRLAQELLAGIGGPSAGTDAAEAARRRLHELLILPAAAFLPEMGLVGIVPDGALHSVPFGLLAHGETTFLEQHPHFVVPTLALALELSARESPPSSTAAGSLLAGDPVLVPSAGAAPLVRLLDLHASPPPDLQASNGRVAALARALSPEGDDETLTLTVGADATELTYAKNAPEKGIVHLSAPLLRFAAEPMFAGLRLARPAVGDDDGLLQAWEIASRPLKARVAVIENTGVSPGLVADEEAMAGLPHGFFTAGVPVVVTNLLPVSPDASAAFFEKFYRALAEGATVSSALRKASLALKSDPRFAQTAAWGAFVAVGLGDGTL